ncbi:MAG: Hsp70 family protein [Candidatus Cyclonatronum sp.]|uniref:Hsp70 family protein n=1 Tax=Cyclonatronum sp. TaxID=3024185 RepID=UPI0025BC79D3|nr:Hsp70 family protein [Cyclonatronum sp.]MCH8487212.1 Hsp70 family protein [Cyclonatronum sp.]
MFLPNNIPVKHEKPRKYYGIDLGTTYSLIAAVYSDEVKDFGNPVPVKFQSFTQKSPIDTEPTVKDEKVASIVAYYDGKPWIGRGLENLKGHQEFVRNQNLFYHFKLDMGIEQQPLYPNAALEKLDSPHKISAAILSYFKRNTAGKEESLRDTVITVPASYQLNQRQDVIKAANLAGIELSNLMLIDEPNAAFIGYFNELDSEDQHAFFSRGTSRNVLVFDIGGGTCDLSILEVVHSREKGLLVGNKAISRYNDLGGQDIDMLIAESFLYPLWIELSEQDEDLPLRDLQQQILPQLALIGEQLKHGICNKLGARYPDYKLTDEQIDATDFSLLGRSLTYQGKRFEFPEITFPARKLADIFEELFKPGSYAYKFQFKHIASIRATITDILEKANYSKQDIDAVLMVGGSSKNPVLISRLKKEFPQSEFWLPAAPDKLVAKGAAVYSYYYYRYGRALVKPIVSDTLGIETKNKHFVPLIERGAELPVSVNAGNFKLQQAFQQELIVPVCLNTTDYVVQDIRIPLNGAYSTDDEVSIRLEINENKVMSLTLHVGDEPLLNYTLENPFFFGALSKHKVEFLQLKRAFEQAKSVNDNNKLKSLYLQLMSLNFNVGNHHENVLLGEEYQSRYSEENSSVIHYLYLGNDGIGRKEAAMGYLRKAIGLKPLEPAFRYNYSLYVGQEEGDRAALDYLLDCPEQVKQYYTIRCRIVILKNRLGEDVKKDAEQIAADFSSGKSGFSKYDKDNLLGQIFSLAGKNYIHEDEKQAQLRNEKVLIQSTKPVKR